MSETSSAFYFGQPALCGHLHAPQGKPRSSAVVICPSLGEEALRTQRAFRALAGSLAALGFWVLRFDYLGTGDSMPSDPFEDPLSGWTASINAAVTWAKDQLNVERVALVGLSFGATLAAVEGARREDISALVMVNGFATGDAYLRQVNTASTVDDASTAGSRTRDSFSEAALTSMKRVTLSRLPHSPARNVLLMSRDDAPADEALVESLRKTGAEVSTQPFAGYAHFVCEPLFAKTPQAAFAAIVQWLANALPKFAGSRPQPELSPRLRPSARGWTEEAVLWGERSLFGVVSSPAHATGGEWAAVFLNDGATPHAGNHGLSVRLARALARDGLTCLRFDPSDVGESPSGVLNRPPTPYTKEACADLHEALDVLAARGKRRVMLVGLGSGAYTAFHTALGDTRVSAVALINAERFTPTTNEALEIVSHPDVKSSGFYLRALGEASTWKRLASGDIDTRGIAGALLQRAATRTRIRGREALADVFGAMWEKNEVARGFLSLCDRHVQTLLVYSSGNSGIGELEKHLGPQAMRLRSHRELHFKILEGADHTLSAKADRAVLEALLREHAQRV